MENIDLCPLRFSNKFALIQDFDVFSRDKSNVCFVKSMQISPDGKQVLLSQDNDIASVYTIDKSLLSDLSYYKDGGASIDDEMMTTTEGSGFKSAFTSHSDVDIGESIFDMKYYPLMNSDDSATCCFATSSRDHPIHLWDVTTSHLRCSYAGHNHYDELDTSFSISFNLSGDKLYAGSYRMLRVFDVSYPGRNYTNIPLCQSKSDYTGQKGIVSTISFNPDYSKSFAIGTYANSIGLYVEDMDGCALEIRDLDIGGITCLKWSPCGRYIWAGGRNNCNISCWDVRKSQQEIGRIQRDLHSNQKLSFDIDPWGKHLVTGTQSGLVLVYDTQSFQLVAERKALNENSNKNDKQELNCVNSASFHPYSSLIFSATGQRRFSCTDKYLDDETSDDECEDDSTRKKLGKSNTEIYRQASGIQVWKVSSETIQIPEPLYDDQVSMQS